MLLPLAVGARGQKREENCQRGNVAPHVGAVGTRQEVPAVAVEAACPRATFVAKEL
jgi:hypothetical protein